MKRTSFVINNIIRSYRLRLGVMCFAQGVKHFVLGVKPFGWKLSLRSELTVFDLEVITTFDDTLLMLTPVGSVGVKSVAQAVTSKR